MAHFFIWQHVIVKREIVSTISLRSKWSSKTKVKNKICKEIKIICVKYSLSDYQVETNLQTYLLENNCFALLHSEICRVFIQITGNKRENERLAMRNILGGCRISVLSCILDYHLFINPLSSNSDWMVSWLQAPLVQLVGSHSISACHQWSSSWMFGMCHPLMHQIQWWIQIGK